MLRVEGTERSEYLPIVAKRPQHRQANRWKAEGYRSRGFCVRRRRGLRRMPLATTS